jgi:hypothetical protein
MNPAPSAPIPNAPKKGPPILAILGFGCLALVVAGGIGCFLLMKACTSGLKGMVEEAQKNPAKTAAMIMIKANPDLEIVKTDDGAGEVTVRDKKSGEVTTISFNDISQGKFKVKNSKGEEVTFDSKGKDGTGSVVVKNNEGTTVIGGDQQSTAPPAWVPQYPGIQTKNGGMRSEKSDSVSGLFSGETGDAPAKVKDFYESKLKEGGFTTEATNVSAPNLEMLTVKATKNDGKITVNVVISTEQGKKTQVTVQYEGPKS